MKYGRELLIALVSVFAPIEKTIATVAVMILLDLVTGVAAAIKRKEPVTSSGLRRTASKLLVFETALCLGFLAEHYIKGSMPFTNLIGGFISLTEVTSCIENLNEISGGSLLKSLLQKLGSQNSK